MPITWQNVNTRADAPTLAANPLAQSGQSFNNAFDVFSKLLGQREAIDRSNVQASQEAGKQAYLDLVASAKTPEELAALQASGKLDAAKASLGTQALAAIRGADEARMSTVRANTTAANAFNDTIRNRLEVPIIGAIKDQALRGDVAGARKALAESNIYDKSGTEAFLHDLEQKFQAEGEHNKLFPFQLDAAKRQAELGGLQVTAAQQDAQDRNTDRAISQALGAAGAAHAQAVTQARAQVDNALKDWTGAPIPRRSDGSISFESLTAPQIGDLNTYLKNRGMPTLQDLQSGDTQAYEQTLLELRKRGFTANQIAKAVPQAGALFDTSPKAPVGNDLAALSTQQRSSDARAQYAQDNYGQVIRPGDPAFKNYVDELTKTLEANTDPGSAKRNHGLQAIAKLVTTGGIALDDPSDPSAPKIRVAPPLEQAKAMLQEGLTRHWNISEWSWFNPNGADAALSEWANKAENQHAAKEAVKYANTQAIRKVLQKDAPN